MRIQSLIGFPLGYPDSSPQKQSYQSARHVPPLECFPAAPLTNVPAQKPNACFRLQQLNQVTVLLRLPPKLEAPPSQEVLPILNSSMELESDLITKVIDGAERLRSSSA